MSLPTLPTVKKLQDALHAKAKRSPEYRFHALYDKVYRADVLWTAHRRCLINGGAAGVDGQTFEDIEEYGSRKWLDELAEGNYFSLGPVSKAYQAVNAHVCLRLRRWLCRKHKVPGRGTSRYPDAYLYEKLGLAPLRTQRRNLSWANA